MRDGGREGKKMLWREGWGGGWSGEEEVWLTEVSIE